MNANAKPSTASTTSRRTTFSQTASTTLTPCRWHTKIWRHAQDEHPELAQRASSLPNVVHATRHTPDHTSLSGVLIHSQTVTGSDAFAFVSPDGQQRRASAQETLTLARVRTHHPSRATPRRPLRTDRSSLRRPAPHPTRTHHRSIARRPWQGLANTARPHGHLRR